jgi:hypothetical protein
MIYYTLEVNEDTPLYPSQVYVTGMRVDHPDIFDYRFDLSGALDIHELEALVVDILEGVDEGHESVYFVYEDAEDLNVPYSAGNLMLALRFLLNIDFEVEGLDE